MLGTGELIHDPEDEADVDRDTPLQVWFEGDVA